MAKKIVNEDSEIKSASGILEAALETNKGRDKSYGRPYVEHGKIMTALFPKGIKLESVDDFNRFGLLNMLVAKLHRYTKNVSAGKTHIDSLHDMIVYSALLEEVDREWLNEKIKSINNF